MSEHSSAENIDSDLPVVAALAAAELGKIHRGETTELDNVEKLSALISHPSFFLNTEEVFSRSLADPNVLNWGQKNALHSIEDLNAAVNRVREAREDVGNIDQDEFLDGLRLFCIAISRYALANRESLETPLRPAYQR